MGLNEEATAQHPARHLPVTERLCAYRDTKDFLGFLPRLLGYYCMRYRLLA